MAKGSGAWTTSVVSRLGDLVQRFDETCRTGTGTRVLGLVVLLSTLSLGIWIAATGGAPTWTWALLGCFFLVSALASIHNFGDQWHVDDEGLSYRNTITALVGWSRERHVPWSKVMKAANYEGKTWFLTIEDEKRWVLDHLAEHERLALVFQELGISVTEVEKPKPFRRDGSDPGAPR